jgi:hypothetical protein
MADTITVLDGIQFAKPTTADVYTIDGDGHGNRQGARDGGHSDRPGNGLHRGDSRDRRRDGNRLYDRGDGYRRACS